MAEGSTEAADEVHAKETIMVGYLSLEDGPSTPEKVISSAKPGSFYTVDDAIEKIGFGPFQILLTFFCGVTLLADAMELMILSILSPIVKCQWNLTNFEEAMITSVVFLGVFCGGIFWGVLCDVIGRKKVLLIVDIGILVFGVLSALRVSSDDGRLPGYPWLLICRFGVGFSAAGSAQGATYYAEFLPLKGRGFCLALTGVWWTIGTVLCAVLAIGVLGYGGLGWHWFLGLAATPLALVLVLFPFVPESARFYMVNGKYDKAQKVIEKVAMMNFKEMPSGKLISQVEKRKCHITEDIVCDEEIPDHFSSVSLYDIISVEYDEAKLVDNNSGDWLEVKRLNDAEEVVPQRKYVETSKLLAPGNKSEDPNYVDTPSKQNCLHKHLSPLFINGMWKTTVIILFLWFGCSWLYYGVVLLTTSLVRFNPHCVSDGLNNSINTSMYVCEDNQFDTGDYIKILWTAVAEFPGLILTFVIIEIIGRKKTMVIEFLASMIGFLLLFICTSDTVLTIFLFITRAFTSGVFQVMYVYTPEVYPTKSRALGIGICSSAARVGGMATPIIAQVLFDVNDYATLSLYAGSCVVFAVLAMFLAYRDKRKRSP